MVISFDGFCLFGSVERAYLRSVTRLYLFEHFIAHLLVCGATLLFPTSLCPRCSTTNLQLADLIREITGRSFNTLLSGQSKEIWMLRLWSQKTILGVLFLTFRLLVESVCSTSMSLGEGSKTAITLWMLFRIMIYCAKLSLLVVFGSFSRIVILLSWSILVLYNSFDISLGLLMSESSTMTTNFIDLISHHAQWFFLEWVWHHDILLSDILWFIVVALI